MFITPEYTYRLLHYCVGRHACLLCPNLVHPPLTFVPIKYMPWQSTRWWIASCHLRGRAARQPGMRSSMRMDMDWGYPVQQNQLSARNVANLSGLVQHSVSCFVPLTCCFVFVNKNLHAALPEVNWYWSVLYGHQVLGRLFALLPAVSSLLHVEHLKHCSTLTYCLVVRCVDKRLFNPDHGPSWNRKDAAATQTSSYTTKFAINVMRGSHYAKFCWSAQIEYVLLYILISIHCMGFMLTYWLYDIFSCNLKTQLCFNTEQ